jgi:hypothetical protein
MQLTDDELQDVLTRAAEIQRVTRHGQAFDAELRAVIGAAEEVGFSRQAVERALRETLNLPLGPPAVGSLVFAKSADEKFYVAEVLSVSQDDIRVRFLRGSEHSLTLDQLRPCSFRPGERIACYWPWWGPWTCTLVSYDAEKQRVKLNDGWGYTKSFPVSEVWMAPPKASPESRAARKRLYATLIGAGAGLGALVGSIITALITA